MPYASAEKYRQYKAAWQKSHAEHIRAYRRRYYLTVEKRPGRGESDQTGMKERPCTQYSTLKGESQ